MCAVVCALTLLAHDSLNVVAKDLFASLRNCVSSRLQPDYTCGLSPRPPGCIQYANMNNRSPVAEATSQSGIEASTLNLPCTLVGPCVCFLG